MVGDDIAEEGIKYLQAINFKDQGRTVSIAAEYTDMPTQNALGGNFSLPGQALTVARVGFDAMTLPVTGGWRHDNDVSSPLAGRAEAAVGWRFGVGAPTPTRPGL